MLNVSETVRSYSGRRGCMCGCLGKYFEDVSNRQRTLNALLKNPDTKLEYFGGNPSDGAVGCLYAYTGKNSTRVLYLTKNGVEIARRLPKFIS